MDSPKYPPDALMLNRVVRYPRNCGHFTNLLHSGKHKHDQFASYLKYIFSIISLSLLFICEETAVSIH